MSDTAPMFSGKVTHPPPEKLMANAREELDPPAFEALMRVTEGRPPTPAQLVAAVEEHRHVTRT